MLALSVTAWQTDLIGAMCAKLSNNSALSGSFLLDFAVEARAESELEILFKDKQISYSQQEGKPSRPLAGSVIICDLQPRTGIAADGSQKAGLCRANVKTTDNEIA